ncbi:MAG: hypothetical protein NT150_01465, partial [Bacteroidetes bacterium]|nr:hypothetical protein [Bacteroidota bacterium]
KFVRVDNDNTSRTFEVTNLNVGTIEEGAETSNSMIGKKEYEVVDHLGNVRALVADGLVSGKTEVISAVDYLPFGMEARVYSSHYRYGMNGQESESELLKGIYSAQFWRYDSRLGRRWNLDPKPSIGISQYSCFENNPNWFVDKLGDTAAVFKPDGTFWKIKDDGKEEWSILHYTKVKEVIHIESGVSVTYKVYTNAKTYKFADPVADPKAIKDGIINKLVFVDVNKAAELLGKAGAFDAKNREAEYSYMNRESKGGGKLDFSYSAIPGAFAGASSDPLNTPSPMLFIASGDNYAHNHMNFGNFLWAAAGNSLGFSGVTLSAAAHYNSVMNSETNGYGAQLDSKDDQLSISRGTSFAQENKFKDRTWSASSGLSAKPKTR